MAARFARLVRPRTLAAAAAGLFAGALLWALPLERPRCAIALEGDEGMWRSALAPDGSRLCTATSVKDRGDVIQLWDTTSGELIATLAAKDGYHCVSYSPDGRNIAVHPLGLEMPYRPPLEVWDVDSGRRLKEIPNPRAGVAFSPAGRLLVYDSEKHQVRDAETGHPAYDAPPAIKGSPLGLCAAAIVYPSADGKALQVFQTGTGKFIAENPLPLGVHHWGSTVNADGTTLIATFSDHAFTLGDDHYQRGPRSVSSRGEPWRRFPPADAAVMMQVSPDGRYLAGYFDEVVDAGWFAWLPWRGESRDWVRVYDLDDGSEVATFRGGRHGEFSPDGRTVAVYGPGAELRLWDFPVRKPWGVILGGAALAGVLVYFAAWGVAARRRRKAVTA